MITKQTSISNYEPLCQKNIRKVEKTLIFVQTKSNNLQNCVPYMISAQKKDSDLLPAEYLIAVAPPMTDVCWKMYAFCRNPGTNKFLWN